MLIAQMTVMAGYFTFSTVFHKRGSGSFVFGAIPSRETLL
jgi:hypothetical protein